ncbi:hypothetical protein Trco_001287 [Trichoderma cornu-damae]|uniref:Uncharacterized protein n=1 Tax=Trichoderma cornu-damae TaxID=654480 RepID=A0A9P8QYM7_9HYPO|nr:hypothetical protein Trco_001287 [Trichoderma cornu-damae]
MKMVQARKGLKEDRMAPWINNTKIPVFAKYGLDVGFTTGISPRIRIRFRLRIRFRSGQRTSALPTPPHPTPRQGGQSRQK